MSSQLSYRLHGREQRPKTLRTHYSDEHDTGPGEGLGQRAESLFRKTVGDGPQSVFCARPYGQFRGTTQAEVLKYPRQYLIKRFCRSTPGGTPVDVSSWPDPANL